MVIIVGLTENKLEKLSLIQYFEAGFPWKCNLKILSSGELVTTLPLYKCMKTSAPFSILKHSASIRILIYALMDAKRLKSFCKLRVYFEVKVSQPCHDFLLWEKSSQAHTPLEAIVPALQINGKESMVNVNF